MQSRGLLWVVGKEKKLTYFSNDEQVLSENTSNWDVYSFGT